MKKSSDIIAGIIDFFYTGPIRKIIPLQTFRYAVCGGMNMVLDLILYYVCFHYIFRAQNFDAGFIVVSPHIAALCLVFPITFFNGFWLNRNIAFRQSPLRGRVQLSRYMLSVAGAFVLNYLCMKVFVEVLHIFPTPSKAITTFVSVGYSYLMQKYFTFRGCADI